MRNSDVENKIKNAVGRLTPDVLDGILSQCGGRQSAVYVIQSQKQKRRWIQAVAALAAAFMLAFGGLSAYNRMIYKQIDSWIMLDVNPSIELRLNKDDRVVGVDAKNEDAVIILDGMELENTPVDVAVNALIGSMLKFGYIQEHSNSVLLSVESANGERSAVLQRTLADSIGRQLNMVNGAVISQNLTGDTGLKLLADEHRISYGKAALIQKILAENSHLPFSDLAALSVNELNLLVGSKKIEAEGMEAIGAASDTAYIGEAKAKSIALEHAGVLEHEAVRLRAELDCDDGAMVYDVEFFLNDVEYEYEIDAGNGAIIQYDRETENEGHRWEEDTGAVSSQSSGDFIGEDRAAEIAVAHVGAWGGTDFKIELDKDDGVYIYEVEFIAANREYDYEINATTGDIVSWEMDD
jgi:uncharacterized membrane protein YkoI